MNFSTPHIHYLSKISFFNISYQQKLDHMHAEALKSRHNLTCPTQLQLQTSTKRHMSTSNAAQAFAGFS